MVRSIWRFAALGGVVALCLIAAAQAHRGLNSPREEDARAVLPEDDAAESPGAAPASDPFGSLASPESDASGDNAHSPSRFGPPDFDASSAFPAAARYRDQQPADSVRQASAGADGEAPAAESAAGIDFREFDFDASADEGGEEPTEPADNPTARVGNPDPLRRPETEDDSARRIAAPGTSAAASQGGPLAPPQNPFEAPATGELAPSAPPAPAPFSTEAQTQTAQEGAQQRGPLPPRPFPGAERDAAPLHGMNNDDAAPPSRFADFEDPALGGGAGAQPLAPAPPSDPYDGEPGGVPGLVQPQPPPGTAAQYETEQALTQGNRGAGEPDARIPRAQTPSLVIERVAYWIVVRNVGNAPAHGVVVEDQIPAGTDLADTEPPARQQDGLLVWDLGTIEPGAEHRIQVDVVPVEDGEIGSVATVRFAAEVSSLTRVTRPRLILETNVPETARIGETVTLRFLVSNPGSGTATNVVLYEQLPEGLRHPQGEELEYVIGDLAPGEVREAELELSVIGSGRLRNIAWVEADGDLRADAESTIDVAAPALALTKTGPTQRYVERPAVYTNTVQNQGSAAADGLVLVDHLPEGMQFVEATAGGRFDPQARTVTWMLGSLEPGEAQEVSVTLLPVALGEMEIRLTAVGDGALQAEETIVTDVEGLSAMNLEVVDLADPIEVGGETTYEIRVTNQGTGPATNVGLSVRLPAEMQLVSADGPTDLATEGPELRFQAIPQLGPREEVAYQLRVQTVAEGDVRFHVQLTSDQLQAPVNEEESTRIYGDG